MKCSDCQGQGHFNGSAGKETCMTCGGTGKAPNKAPSKFEKTQQKTQLQQLREKVKNLDQSRTDLIVRATELQGKLNAYKNDVEQALELASFYEKQALENEKLAGLFKQILTALAECKVDISDITLVPDKIKQLATIKNSSIQLLKDNGIIKGDEEDAK